MVGTCWDSSHQWTHPEMVLGKVMEALGITATYMYRYVGIKCVSMETILS